ncbi:bifunctional diguanylate cyclase/phosphodiesterase [Ideonella sp.]|uniref:putative bifunctional diguanylate cyclase/phosphodiesterase n=1 Tax=Ideonella sp. TaxID=1929293 RepID=UPI002E37A250|nr:bifunctional diguanylate cyclase/phosphodiesterase [Ideonella sp.]
MAAPDPLFPAALPPEEAGLVDSSTPSAAPVSERVFLWRSGAVAGLGSAAGAGVGAAASLALHAAMLSGSGPVGVGAAVLGAVLGAAVGGLAGPLALSRHPALKDAGASTLDRVTGLPTRAEFLADVQRERDAERQRRGSAAAPQALLLLGLDRLRALNDSLGHEIGDLWLHEAGSRLVEAFDPPALIARLGNDEFALLSPAQPLRADDPALLGLGEALLHRLRRPFFGHGGELHLTASAGATWLTADKPIEQALREADLALRRAKRAGRDCVRVFEPSMKAEHDERARLLTALRSAVPAQEFRLHYQPQVDRAGRVVGAEALLRWESPELGTIDPSRFIPLAEESGLIVPIGRAVIRDACAVLAWWSQDPATKHLTLSVNVSPHQFQHPTFVEDVRLALQTAGVSPSLLKLEVTENVIISDMPSVQAHMQALRELGVRLSLDDFGIGYSSLSYLKHLPLSQLKIDRIFVRNMLTDPREAALVRTVIALARDLALELVAEGVETPEQREMLSDLGCGLYQGYLFGRPVPLESLCVVQ